MNLTTLTLDAKLQEIRKCESLEEMLQMVKKIDALKTALEAVDTFREQSIKYARLEAEALLQVVDLGGLDKLKGLHRKTADWLSNLSEVEREEMIAKCADGLTIDQVYKMEFGAAASLGKGMEEAKQHIADVLEEVKKNGIVDISETTPFIKQCVKDPFVANAMTDGLRERLRDVGAVCVEKDSGIYVMPNSANKNEIRDAVMLRYESIVNDFKKIKKICKEANFKLTYEDFAPTHGWELSNNPFYNHLLIGLMSINAFSEEDNERLYSLIAKTDFRKEFDNVVNSLRIGRERAIEMFYEDIKKSKKAANDAATS